MMMEVVIGDTLDTGKYALAHRSFKNYSKGMRFSLRVVALFKSDYIGMNLSIKGWGKEDVDLYDR